MLYFLN